MFERFTRQARQAVLLAQQEARRRRHDSVDTDHVLLALLAQPDTAAGAVLAELGVTRADIDAEIVRRRGAERPGPTDRDALASIGIDLDEVRRQVEHAFGPGALERTRARRRHRHVPFERGTKRALEGSLREALRLRDRHIGTEHVLLGLLTGPASPAHRMLTERGISLDTARAAIARWRTAWQAEGGNGQAG